jgi:TPR repeat protein
MVLAGGGAGDVGAFNSLAALYETGRGVLLDAAEVATWPLIGREGRRPRTVSARPSTSPGHGVQQDIGLAVSLLRQSASQGLADAQFTIGMVYLQGQGVAVDAGEGIQWLRKAANQGHVAAQNNLAIAYATGAGVERDPREAIRWWQTAADAGDAMAAANLAAMYVAGNGVQPDPSRAVYWWREAAQQEGARSSRIGVGARGWPRTPQRCHGRVHVARAGGRAGQG